MERATFLVEREASQTWSFRGSKSRNKVSVGEPAEGSLRIIINCENYTANNNFIVKTKKKLKLLTMDLLVLVSMKNAAKRDISCELQK